MNTCGHCGGWQLARKRPPALPRSTFGSPEDLIERGTPLVAEQTERLGIAIAKAVHGLSSARAINAAIRATGKGWNVNRLALPLQVELTHGAVLGALDADFEGRTNRPVKVESFAALHAPLLLAPYDRSTDPAFATRPVGDARKQFERREAVTRPVYDAMTDAARRRAVTVAGAATSEVVRTVQRELVQQVAQGAELRDFAKRVVPRLEAAGWTPQNASHVENVLRTNVGSAYNAGRARQMTQPTTLRLRPYWQIVTVNDGPPRQRPTHQAAHLVVLRADDPFWLTAYPPFGYQCRCRVRSLGQRAGESLVVSGSSIHDLPDRGFTSGLSILDIPPPSLPPANDTLPPPANDTIPPQGSLAEPPPPVPKFKAGFGEMSAAERANIDEAVARARVRDPSFKFAEPPPFEFKVDPGAEHAAKPVVDALNEAGFSEFYADKHMSGLHIAPEGSPPGAPVGTNYFTSEFESDWRGSGKITVGVESTEQAIKALGDRTTMYVGDAAATTIERAQSAARHEFGHAVHLHQQGMPLQKEIDAVVEAAWIDRGDEFISRRAHDYNGKEYFAEAFDAYHGHRKWMQANAPKALSMVERVLKMRGLL